MKIIEGNRTALEMEFLSKKLPLLDDSLLEYSIREMMSNQANTPILTLTFLDIPPVKKSEKISIVCCVMGEKALTDNGNDEALKAFTNALRCAPGSSKINAHCYFWRSIALQKLKAYSESLEDIKRALKFRITKEQKTNLLNRKKVLQDLLLKATDKKSTGNKDENTTQEEVKLSYGENEEIQGVSSAMALSYNEKFGRFFVATCDIKIGDVLMIQSPLMWTKLGENEDDPKGKKWFCDYCLHSTVNLIPCDNCTCFLYCSFKCRSSAFKMYHKIECQLSNFKTLFGPQTTLFLRTLLVVTNQGENFQEVGKLMEKIKNCKDKRTAGFKDGKLDGKNANAVLSLLHHIDKQQLSGLVFYSAHMAMALKKYTNFLKENNPNDVFNLGKLLVFLSYICHMNLYGIRRNNFNDRIAYAMYPIFNLLNHSCACNTLSYDDRNRNKILRACKDIKKGEQIFVAYNSFQVLELTVEERRQMLLDYKFFWCEFQACERNYSYTLELRGTLKVPLQLKRRLLKRPNDTQSLWQLLKLVLNEYKYPSLQAKTIELALVNAHMGDKNKDLCKNLRSMRVL